MHLGDFDYLDSPSSWENQINSVLGPDFPYIGVVGNHDLPRWSDANTGYQARIVARAQRISGLLCSGDLGVNSSCTFRGLHLLLSGVGTLGSGHATYLKNQLASSNALWKVCAWHKNQQKMQIGGKSDEVGWEAYEECRKGGAIIATGHEHSYERTRTLLNMQTQALDTSCMAPDHLCVDHGRTFAFVSGLGGHSVRIQDLCLPTTFPYGCNQTWGSIYSADQGATYGALFIVFNVDGNPSKAHGYFKNIQGTIIDSFDVFRQAVPKPPSNLRVGS
jgi:hypothetical protein